jgi:hypothetical protein
MEIIALMLLSIYLLSTGIKSQEPCKTDTIVNSIFKGKFWNSERLWNFAEITRSVPEEGRHIKLSDFKPMDFNMLSQLISVFKV